MINVLNNYLTAGILLDGEIHINNILPDWGIGQIKHVGRCVWFNQIVHGDVCNSYKNIHNLLWCKSGEVASV